MSDQGGKAGHRVYSDLVAGLVDARHDEATGRFDAEVAAAVEAGTITAETAHRLRFWQRASVRSLADHAKTVIPTALAALDASRREAIETANAMAETLGPDPQRGEPTEEPPSQEEPDEPGELDEPAQEADTEEAGTASRAPGASDTPEGASTASASRPSSLGTETEEQPSSRLIVADLITLPDVPSHRR